MFRNTVTILLLAAGAAGIDAAEWKIDPSAVFSVATPTSGASGKLHFDFRRFEDDSNLDDNNVRFLTSSYHRMERSELGLDLDFIKDTTLDSQLENTGLILDRTTRYRVNLAPSWAYNMPVKIPPRCKEWPMS